MRRLLPIFALVGLGILGCGKRTEQPKVYKDTSLQFRRMFHRTKSFSAPAPGSQEMEVWNGELALFQAKDLDTFMSLWDEILSDGQTTASYQRGSGISKPVRRMSSKP